MNLKFIPVKPMAFLLAAAPLVLVSCTSTNPQPAFDDVAKTATERTGHRVQWMRDDATQAEIEKTVASLLQTNLTVDRAVAIGLMNNRGLQAEFEKIGISQAELSAASRLRNPEFDGMWRVPKGGSGLNAEYSIAQEFLDLLTLPARKAMATRNLESTKLRVAHAILSHVEEVRTAFYTVQAAQHLTNRMGLILEVAEAAADVAQRQHAAGNINDLQLLNQQTSYAQVRLDASRAVTRLRADREKLNRLLGLWGRQVSWQIAEELPRLPEKELPLDNLEAIAVRQRLDLSAARESTANLEGALRLKKSVRWLPGAHIGASAEHELDHTWVIGPTLSLEIPIFDQGQPELARMGAEYHRAARNLEALAVNIRSEIRDARDAFVAARNTAEYHEKVLLPQRQRLLRETLLQYNAMQLSTIELLHAKEREQEEEQAAIEALRDYWIARARLETALGGSAQPAPAAQNQTGTKAKTEEHHHDH
jgi:cobalt-zinc-cadmium efflux system outer membrane protein